MIILGTQSPKYKRWWLRQGDGRFNGAYWYAKEIEDIILPEIKSNAFINTVAVAIHLPYQIPIGAFVVAHDNHQTIQRYRKLFNKGITWICSLDTTQMVLEQAGEKTAFIPLSVDSEYVSQFETTEKTEGTAFFGNSWGFKQKYLNELKKGGEVAILSKAPRHDLLAKVAKYENVIAEGRCAIEAQMLGCNVTAPDYEREFNSVVPPMMDSREVIPMWREVLTGGSAL